MPTTWTIVDEVFSTRNRTSEARMRPQQDWIARVENPFSSAAYLAAYPYNSANGIFGTRVETLCGTVSTAGYYIIAWHPSGDWLVLDVSTYGGTPTNLPLRVYSFNASTGAFTQASSINVTGSARGGASIAFCNCGDHLARTAFTPFTVVIRSFNTGTGALSGSVSVDMNGSTGDDTTQLWWSDGFTYGGGSDIEFLCIGRTSSSLGPAIFPWNRTTLAFGTRIDPSLGAFSTYIGSDRVWKTIFYDDAHLFCWSVQLDLDTPMGFWLFEFDPSALTLTCRDANFDYENFQLQEGKWEVKNGVIVAEVVNVTTFDLGFALIHPNWTTKTIAGGTVDIITDADFFLVAGDGPMWGGNYVVRAREDYVAVTQSIASWLQSPSVSGSYAFIM